MSTSVVPALIDALVTQATSALSGVTVLDGYGVTSNQGNFLMVGVDDPTNEGAATSAQVEQRAATMGTSRSRDETGSINCVALAWNGGTNQKTVRDAAYTITTAVENLIRSNPTLGVSGVLWTGFGDTSQLTQQQSADEGCWSSVAFSIVFRARI